MTSKATDHLRYWRLPAKPPGELQVLLMDAGLRFTDIAGYPTGKIIHNAGFESLDDPDPEKRFRWQLVPGQWIHDDNFSGPPRTHAPTLGENAPFEWRGGPDVRMPNWELRAIQQIQIGSDQEAVFWVDTERRRYLWSDSEKWVPLGQVLTGQGTEQERLVNQFGLPVTPGLATQYLRARPGPGRYGLRYQEWTEATGSRNTINRDPQGHLIFGYEAEQAEPVEDVFFHAFDTTDVANFKITREPSFLSPEIPFSVAVGHRTTPRLHIHLVPRQWFFFCYILAWYMVVTLWDFFMHPLPFTASWWDRPPAAPYPFTGVDYMADIYGGMDDYGVYWQVTHSPQFLELLSQVHDFEMTSWLMGIIFAGIDTFYYRVRCFGAKAEQLCAVIEDARSGALSYVWRRTAETKDAITLVDSQFWPEGYAG